MIGLLMKMLPVEYRNLIALGQRLFENLDTPAERAAVIDKINASFTDGKISVGEWASIGKSLGLLTGPDRSKAKRELPKTPK